MIFFPTAPEYEDEAGLEWLGIRGVRLDKEVGLLKADITCKHLTADNKCAIHDHKPQVCKDFEPGSTVECPLYKKEEE